MPDLKKVLAGLKCCASHECYAAGCPYYDNDVGIEDCTGMLAADAMTLLRQQNEKIISLKRERAAMKEALTEERFPSFGVMGTAMPLISPADKLTGEKVEMIMGEPLPEPPKEETC